MTDINTALQNLNLTLLPLYPYLSNHLKDDLNKKLDDLKKVCKISEDKNEILLKTIDDLDADLEERNEEIDSLTAQLDSNTDEYEPLLKAVSEGYSFGYDAERLEKINEEYRILCLNTLAVTP